MIPNGAVGVGLLASPVIASLIAKAPDAYTAADIGLLTALVDMVRQDYDRAAAVHVADQREIAAIFEVASAEGVDAGLKARMAAAAARNSASLKVSDLAVRTDALMAVLIDLHAAVEVAADGGAGWAVALDARIWDFLDAHVGRHAYESAF